ncbi:MAG: hypothetical protein ACOYL6_08265 [Bacteriovoracaceae bacterium]
MKYLLLIIIGFSLYGCSSHKEKSDEAINLAGLEECWKKKCSQDKILDLYGSARPESQVKPEFNQWVYFGEEPTLTPFTSFTFNSDHHVIHISHIPKKLNMTRVYEVIKCEWAALENSPYVSRQMNDEVTFCHEEEITVHFNAVTQQVLKISWGKIPKK